MMRIKTFALQHHLLFLLFCEPVLDWYLCFQKVASAFVIYRGQLLDKDLNFYCLKGFNRKSSFEILIYSCFVLQVLIYYLCPFFQYFGLSLLSFFVITFETQTFFSLQFLKRNPFISLTKGNKSRNFLKIRRAWAHINMTIWQKWALNLRDSNLAPSKYLNLYLLVRDILSMVIFFRNIE